MRDLKIEGSPQRHAARADGLIELLGDALDALGGRRQRGGDRGLRPLLRDYRRAGVLQGGELLLQPLDARPGLDELVGDRDRRDRGQARVADLAEFGAQRTDATIEIAAGSVARAGKRIGRRSEAVDMKVPVWI